ncbi:MAG: hypothetical protein NVS9B5_36670 [Terriglobales bacterium]
MSNAIRRNHSGGAKMRIHFVLLAAVIGSAFVLAAQDATNSMGAIRVGKKVPLLLAASSIW